MNRTKTKIFGTLGPACRDGEVLKRMFQEGMDGIRLNLSHTALEDAADMIKACRVAARECGVEPELLIDMQGPELRIGELEEPLRLTAGEMISAGDIPFPEAVTEALRDALANRPSGQEILLDDGKILLETAPDDGTRLPKEGTRLPGAGIDEPEGDIPLRVVRGGLLQSRKSVALPGCRINTPAMTDRDRQQIRLAKQFGVTAVMQPFVRSREDLLEVRAALDQAGCGDIRLLAKIESRAGIRKLEELIPHCDEIVIARGDLGNDMELWELPAAQKRISAVCRERGRDFMVVTQMLDSMIRSQIPTRAEVSDIFNAVADGASSVMVTGETAVGEYPDLVIRYLFRTAREAERYCGRGDISYDTDK